jgi:amino acid transporter
MNSKKHFKLNQWYATALCGNDILSSALYVSGIAIIFAGIYAPLVLLLVGLVLFFYKSVYTEVVEALPINGGAYNCLLNATSKPIAAIAGVTTILSYMATAVISGSTAVNYLRTIIPSVPAIPATAILLLAFALLVIAGVKDSAKVALGIFIFHLFILSAFIIFGLMHLHVNFSQFQTSIQNNPVIIQHNGGLILALFFAFASSLLGVSGFESSANFVEEQKEGVFRKTLRNMLIGVVIFNPLIALAILGVMSHPEIITSKEFILSDAAKILSGSFFQILVVIDAFLVLAGAVLTSYVGVGGLIFRMASDGCLPNLLTKKNKSGSYPRIVITFFILCTSILILTKGDLFAMAGVYTIAFLSVMSLFAFGNILLREKRSELKRTYSAPFLFVLSAFVLTVAGVIGSIMIDSRNLINFLIYFTPAVFLVLTMVYLDDVLRFLIRFTNRNAFINGLINKYFEDVTSGTVLVFINHSNRLYSVLHYIHRNETAKNIIFVHCKNWDNKNDRERYHEINDKIPVLQEAGVFPKLNIKHHYLNIPFGPEAISEASKEFKVRRNRIMIGSIHRFHDFEYSDLGGVRIIF